MNNNQNLALSKGIFPTFSQEPLSPLHNLEQESVSRAKVALMPIFNKAPAVQAIDNLQQAGEAIRRMAERTYKKMATSPRGRRTLASANEYSIPYDPNDVDWLRLISQIEEYESLLKQARDYNVSFDTGYYDPIGLEQLIEDCVSQERRWSRDQNADYLSTRL